jgi:hypothetical protein
LQTHILEEIFPGSKVYTDEHTGYMGLEKKFAHEVVNHLETYLDRKVHTNGIENFWSLLKRGLKGTYVAVEPLHCSGTLTNRFSDTIIAALKMPR